MREIKIAELSEILNVDDAIEALMDWLRGYADQKGDGPYVIDDVHVVKREDGWYAILHSEPRRARRVPLDC